MRDALHPYCHRAKVTVSHMQAASKHAGSESEAQTRRVVGSGSMQSRKTDPFCQWDPENGILAGSACQNAQCLPNCRFPDRKTAFSAIFRIEKRHFPKCAVPAKMPFSGSENCIFRGDCDPVQWQRRSKASVDVKDSLRLCGIPRFRRPSLGTQAASRYSRQSDRDQAAGGQSGCT